MTAIYKRELKSYFCSMTGYIFIAFVTMFMGIYFMATNMIGGYPYFGYTLSGITTILLLAIPVLTMRSMSEERRSKTDQLLLTSPVSLWSIVLGKYLSMVTIFAVPVLVSCFCPLIIRMNGTAYLAEDYGAILTFFLLGCTYIAIGLFISSLTESQLIAAAGTFGIMLILILWPSLINFMPTTARDSLIGLIILWSILAFILYRVTESVPFGIGAEIVGVAAMGITFFVKQSLFERALVTLMEKMVLADIFNTVVNDHILEISGLVFYVSVTFVLLFLTVQTTEKRRWS